MTGLPRKHRWKKDYEAEILPGLPGTGATPLVFSAMLSRAGKEGLVVEVRRSDGSWVGNFQRGDGKLNVIVGTPSPNHVCVVAGGRGYWVPTHSPEKFEIVEAYPVQQIWSVPEADLLVLADYTELVGYSTDGLKWRSGWVSWDGINILRADDKGIVGEAWDASQERWVGFFTDVRTGRTEGGAARHLS